MIVTMILVLLGVIVAVSIIEAQVSIDYDYYCSNELNCETKPPKSHVMCSYPTNWASECKTPRFIPMTDALKQLFLESHNTRRNVLALGNLPGLFEGKQAVNMAEMIWDDELEMLAQKNLITCEIRHDQCRKTKKFLWAGQNLALKCKEPHITVEEAIKNVNEAWWNEYKDIKSIDAENNYTSINANKQYGHFTQMARDKAFAIGCAVTLTENDNCYNVACNYAITNWLYDPVYFTGKLRSECKTFSGKYDGLCGDKEDYTNYERNGIRFFTKDHSVVKPLEQWKANERMLITSNANTNIKSTSITSSGSYTPHVSQPLPRVSQSLSPRVGQLQSSPVTKQTSHQLEPRITVSKISTSSPQVLTTPKTTMTSIRSSASPQTVSSQGKSSRKISLGSIPMKNMDNVNELIANVKKQIEQQLASTGLINIVDISKIFPNVNIQLSDTAVKNLDKLRSGKKKIKNVRISESTTRMGKHF